MRRWLARKLRKLAHRLDGASFVEWSWHEKHVEATNRYVATAEGYIIALEEALGKDRATAIRQKHPGRFDTKPLWDAGAWMKWRRREEVH